MARKNRIDRYLAISFSGVVLATGQRISDVAKLGERVIVDYFKLRYSVQGMYPQTRHHWHGLNDLGERIRASTP